MLNIELPYNLAILILELVYILGVYSKELKRVHTSAFTQMFIAALFIVAKNENTPNVHHLMNG